MDANDAASYVQELTGEDSNIIFGAMYDDSVADYARITVIATGLSDLEAKITPFGNRSNNTIWCSQTGSRHCRDKPRHSSRLMSMPSFNLPNMQSTPTFKAKYRQALYRRKTSRFRISLRNR